MRQLALTSIMGTLIMTGACATTTAPDPATLTDAVLRDTDAQSLATLSGVISNALNGRSITLASDALGRDSRVIIEQRITPETAGVRNTSKPDWFYLKTDGSNCWLLHDQTGELHEVKGVSCMPMPDSAG